MIARMFALIAFLLSLSLVYSAPLICNTNQLVEDPSVINLVGDTRPYARFYSKPNFQGHREGIPSGETFQDGLEHGWKRSIEIPPNHELIMFEEQDFGGSWVVIDKSIPDFFGNLIGFEPESFWHRPKTTDPSVFPRIYAKTSFEGEPLVIPFGLTELPEPKIFGSIKIPMGVTVKLTIVYSPRFSTREIVLTSDIDDLLFTEPVTSVFVSIGPMEL